MSPSPASFARWRLGLVGDLAKHRGNFVLLLGLRLSLFFLAPGWLLGWLAGEVVEGRWG